MSEAPLRCPKCACPLDMVHLPGDVAIESCPGCFGAYYDRSELAVAIELSGAMDTAHPCPKCGGPLQTGRYRNQLELEQCPKCRGLWFDSGEIQKLRELSGVQGIVKSPGEVESSDPAVPALMAPAAMKAFTEHLENQRQDARAAAKGKGGKYSDAPDIPDGAHQTNHDERMNPVVRHLDRLHQHFQTSWPVVTYVLGEFPWKVRVGEKAVARDFICPPHIVSQEISGKDAVWSQGEYLQPEEVQEAFKLEGAMPSRIGVAPPQPNPYYETHAGIGSWFWKLTAAAMIVATLIAMFARGEKAFERGYAHLPMSAEKSVVTDVFELAGHTSNVEVALNTSLSNQWAYFSMALINAETDVALDFGRDVSFYTGSDDEGVWREGSQQDTVYLPQVATGKYYLRIEPSTDTGAFSYTVRVTRDVARPSFLIAALLLLLLPVGWVWWRHHSFEHQRWSESDHPWASNFQVEDDDD